MFDYQHPFSLEEKEPCVEEGCKQAATIPFYVEIPADEGVPKFREWVFTACHKHALIRDPEGYVAWMRSAEGYLTLQGEEIYWSGGVCLWVVMDDDGKITGCWEFGPKEVTA